MRRSSQNALLLLVGVGMLRLGLTDLHLRFVKPAMQPLIVSAALVLVLAGAVGIWQQESDGRSGGLLARLTGRGRAVGEPGPAKHEHVEEDESEHGGHGHEHGAPRTAWLLGLPLVVLFLVAPPALGADAVARSLSTSTPPVGSAVDLPALAAPSDGAVDLSLTEYAERAVYAPQSLRAVPVRLLGFAVPDEDGWLLARITLSCCAADGRPVIVRMSGPGATPVPGRDTWLEVVGTLPVIRSGSEYVQLSVEDLHPAATPSSPYEAR